MSMPQSAPFSAAPRAPMLDNVGAALRFARLHWQTVALIAAIGAGASVAVSMIALGLGNAQTLVTLAISLAATLVSAGIYTALISAALPLPHAPQQFIVRMTRMWSAMAVIVFFLVIVGFALVLVCSIAIGPILAPYAGAVQAAGQDQGAMMALGARFAQENPGVVAGVFALFSVVLMLLTSRFFVAGPASLEAGRILTFETWKWTKGSMWRIAGARIIVLGPALVLSQTLSLLFARALGFDALQGGLQGVAEHNPAAYGAFAFVSEFVTILLYQSLEAGLASSFYHALKPKTPPKPA